MGLNIDVQLFCLFDLLVIGAIAINYSRITLIKEIYRE